MPSPSDSSSVASASGSRGWSDSRRGMSGRGPGGARLLLYLGLCHLGLGAMVLAFSFTSMAFTSSARVRQSCPFWAGFFVVASGIVGIISWRRPLTLVVSLFMLLSAVCVILSLAGSMLSCQNAQMVKSMLTCQVENGLCVCCAPTHSCSITEEETLVLYLNADCHSLRHQLKDLLFSACGLSILSTIICTLSTVTCSIHIFSLDLVHLLAPHRSRSVNPECTTPQDAFLTNIMDFEEFVPPIPPPPYYPPEYTCSSETDAQSITYNGSMESPVPLYPTDCPPPYEAVIGQRVASQATVFDPHGTELSGERGTSTAFSGEVSMDSGSLLMSEIVDIPDDSSPSEDSCLMEVGLRNQGERGNRTGEGAERGESFHVDFGSGGSKASTDTVSPQTLFFMSPSSEACLLPRTPVQPAASLPNCHRSLGDLKASDSSFGGSLPTTIKLSSVCLNRPGARGYPPAQLWRFKLYLLSIATSFDDATSAAWVIRSSLLRVRTVRRRGGVNGKTLNAIEFSRSWWGMRRLLSLVSLAPRMWLAVSQLKLNRTCLLLCTSSVQGDNICNGGHERKALLSDSLLFEAQFEELVTELTEGDLHDPVLADALSRLREFLPAFLLLAHTRHSSTGSVEDGRAGIRRGQHGGGLAELGLPQIYHGKVWQLQCTWVLIQKEHRIDFINFSSSGIGAVLVGMVKKAGDDGVLDARESRDTSRVGESLFSRRLRQKHLISTRSCSSSATFLQYSS
ncbi:Protein FAM189B Protein COTE1 [Channa argus]|uniref:Protein FAM189B Protein COTE1 n=1 Tax=Channa argus TaxID=215402 RepID=A0A6G1PPQ5_CHAAH|nr:Protein FAM189B Protein COTE1 [Channa argus]